LIVCNLTKPEATLDQVKKSYPKLSQTEAALVAAALVLSGRHARAEYDGITYDWPEDNNRLQQALTTELAQLQQSADPPPKKTAKNAVEEEAVEVKVGLKANFNAAEPFLGDREDLKTLLGDILQAGVEYQYSPTDILWQWALDRANWNTVSDGDLTRRVKLRATFIDSTVGTELGVGGVKKRKKASDVEKAEKAVIEPEVLSIDPVTDADAE